MLRVYGALVVRVSGLLPGVLITTGSIGSYYFGLRILNLGFRV